MRLSDFDVLSFDCYGTLIDWESGIVAALAPWLEAHGVAAERERILAAFARAEAPQQQATPGMLYRDLLAVSSTGRRSRIRRPRSPISSSTTSW